MVDGITRITVDLYYKNGNIVKKVDKVRYILPVTNIYKSNLDKRLDKKRTIDVRC